MLAYSVLLSIALPKPCNIIIHLWSRELELKSYLIFVPTDDVVVGRISYSTYGLHATSGILGTSINVVNIPSNEEQRIETEIRQTRI